MSEAGFTDAMTHAATDPQPASGVTARPVTVITGASGGIGADLARVFAKHGHDLALIARSRAKLEALADEIAASGRPRPSVLACDLTEPGAVAKLAASLEAEGARPHILVNNAGFGLAGQIASLEASEQLALIDLNIRALLEMTLRFLPQIREGRGKILNVASIAGYFPGGPGMAAYYASKSFVLSFTPRAFAGIARGWRHGLRALSWLHQDGFSGPGGDWPRHGPHAFPRYNLPGGRGSRLRRADHGTRRDRARILEQSQCFVLAIFAKVRSFGAYFAVAAKSGSAPIRSGLIYLNCEAMPAGPNLRRRILIILHQKHSSPGRLGCLLRAQGCELDCRRPPFGDPLPKTLKDYAGVIVFGGPMSVNDEDGWLRREIDWIGVPLKEDTPFLGICLGAQMLARHLGHRVRRHPQGRVEVGYYPDPSDGTRASHLRMPVPQPRLSMAPGRF